MIAAIDITAAQRKTLLVLLRQLIPGVAVWAYGSRVKWTARPNSDLDLVAFTTPAQGDLVSELKEALAESNLPFLVDFHVWDEVPERFHDIIRKEYVVLQEAQQPVSGSDVAGEALVSAETKSWLYHPVFPEHWKRRALYSLAQWVNGLAFRAIQFSLTGKPVIKIAEIKGGITGQTKFTEQVFDESVHVRAGDLLFSWSGQPETSIDVFWWRGSDGWLNQHSFRVTPVEGIDPTFFFYLLRYLKPSFVGIARNKQTTGLGHVTKRDLENIEAAYPLLPEQHAIAHILGMLDDKIELNRRMNETLEAMARALFQSWFVDFDPVRAKLDGRKPAGLDAATAALFPAHFQDSPIGQIPQGWKVKPLSEITTVITKGTTPTQEDVASAPDTDAQINYVRVNSIEEDGSIISDKLTKIPLSVHTGVLKRSILQANDVLYTIAGTIGRTATAEDWVLPANTNQAVAIIRPKPTIPSSFLVLTMRHEVFREELHNNIVHAVQANLSLGMLSKARAVVPPEDVLLKIFKPIDDIMSQISANRAQSRTLATIRDALLPKLLSGEISVVKATSELETVT